MDWYRRDGADQLICSFCARRRLRLGEALFLAIPRDFVGPRTSDWLQCADCQVVFERVGAVYVPRRDVVEIPAPTPSELAQDADTNSEMENTSTARKPQFTCPLCAATSAENRWGETIDSVVAQAHPWIAKTGIRICRRSYKGIVRLEHAGAEELALITIARR